MSFDDFGQAFVSFLAYGSLIMKIPCVPNFYLPNAKL